MLVPLGLCTCQVPVPVPDPTPTLGMRIAVDGPRSKGNGDGCVDEAAAGPRQHGPEYVCSLCEEDADADDNFWCLNKGRCRYSHLGICFECLMGHECSPWDDEVSAHRLARRRAPSGSRADAHRLARRVQPEGPRTRGGGGGGFGP